MTAVLYVPRDSAARSVGADAVAQAIADEAAARGADVKIVRNGSRGMFWLEPLVEVETAAGRVAYGPVAAEDVPSLFDAGLLAGDGHHALALGLTEEIPFLKHQERLTFARVGVIDPLDLASLSAWGGLDGLKAALEMDGAAICAAIAESGLRGAAVRASPPASSGRRSTTSRRARNTSAATPTRATAVPSPTA